jgi:hypothetical protein
MVSKAKSAKKQPKPLLSAALFCHQVLIGKDNAMSAIRIVDRIDTFINDPNPEIKVPILIWMLISFKSGGVKGERTMKLIWRMPTGKNKLIGEQVLPFNGDEEVGVNSRIRTSLFIKTAGVYWVDVILDRTKYTSVPLRIDIHRGSGDRAKETV